MKSKIIAFLSHRFTPLVLAIAICTTVGVSRYETSKAAAEAITLEALELVPLTWEMFATIMTALGVGTATYWASKEVSDRKLTLDEITEKLVPEVGWFHQEVADFRDHDIPEYIDGVGGWITARVADVYLGAESATKKLTLLPEELLNAFTDFAAEKGWLGGVSAPSVSFPTSDPFTRGTIESFSINNDAFFTLVRARASSVRADAVISLVQSSYSSGYYLACTNMGGGELNFYVYPIASLIGLSTWGGGLSGNTYYVNVDNAPKAGHLYTIDSNGDTTSFISYGLNNNVIRCPANANGVVTNYGAMSTLEGNDVPIGEKGQVVDNDGAIDYPWPVPYPIPVQGSPSFPVTIPDALAPDVVILDPDAVKPGNPPIALDDALSLPGAIDRDLPTDTTQEDAQAGDTDIPEDMPTESPIQPKDYNNFLLPSWIKNKFPFCIPFDLASVGKQFSDSGAEAPVFKYTLRFDIDGGKDHDIVIDMSRFDSVMEVVRMGEFVLFMVGLLFATRKLLRG